MRLLAQALIATSLLATVPSAQDCPLVVDLNAIMDGAPSDVTSGISGYGSALPNQFAHAGGKWFFSASTSATGSELYATDGTASGTSMVKEINPTGDAEPEGMTAVGNRVFFIANDGTSGRELWVSDGTAAGTTMVKDFTPGVGSSEFTPLVPFGNRVIFREGDWGEIGQVWISDGTAPGTSLIKSFDTAGPAGTVLAFDFAVDPSGTGVLFTGFDVAHGYELWSTDGTAAGTGLLQDIAPGPDSSTPNQYLTWNGRTLFQTFHDFGHSLNGIWSTDGTAAGAAMLAPTKTIFGVGGATLRDSAEFQGELYFGNSNGLAAQGLEVWKTDGTPAGTNMVVDVWPGSESSTPGLFTVAGNSLYFHADNQDFHGADLYRIDSGGSLSLVLDTGPGMQHTSPFALMPFGSKLVFVSHTSQEGRMVRITDGTPGGTVPLKAYVDTTSPFDGNYTTPISPTQFLFSADSHAYGEELWISDGTDAGTHLFTEIDSAFTTRSSFPSAFHSLDGKRTLFQADDGHLGAELYIWDPVLGATLVKDINPGSSSSWPGSFYTAWIDNRLVTFFTAISATSGEDLWATDGTAAGTTRIKDFGPASTQLIPGGIVAFNGQGYFFVHTDSGYGMWRSDGTQQGTVLVKDFGQSFAGGGSKEYNGRLYFMAQSPLFGHELWSTDGTEAGTVMVKDINTGQASSTPFDYIESNGELYFAARHADYGVELWKTDGSEAGTTLVTDLYPGPIDGFPSDFLAHNGELFFAGRDPANGTELFRTDGTPGGTGLFADINPGPGSSKPESLIEVAGTIYFSATSPSTGTELWNSDGTLAGTSIALDLVPGPGSSNPDQLMSTGSGLYFTAQNGSQFGHRIWHFDGASSTAEVTCNQPAGSSLTPFDFALANGGLLIAGDFGNLGIELATLPQAKSYTTSLDSPTIGPHLTGTAAVLGKRLLVSCEDVGPGNTSILAMSVPVAAPQAYPTILSGASWLDPTTIKILAWQVGTNWSWQKVIPANPALMGALLSLQVYELNGASLPATASNALLVSIGN